MTTKDAVLGALKEHRGEYLSGEQNMRVVSNLFIFIRGVALVEFLHHMI
ncbi:MAG: hypothetical protein IJ070_00640 [Firmicutes bacterium]|nr:hypothetical protein [Bacillota bacterium]